MGRKGCRAGSSSTTDGAASSKLCCRHRPTDAARGIQLLETAFQDREPPLVVGPQVATADAIDLGAFKSFPGPKDKREKTTSALWHHTRLLQEEGIDESHLLQHFEPAAGSAVARLQIGVQQYGRFCLLVFA